MIQSLELPAEEQVANTDEFVFPVSIKPGMIFQSRTELIKAIDKDKDALRLTLTKKLYRVHNTRGFLRIVCNYCSAAVNTKLLNDNRVQITTVKLDHIHTTAKFNDPVEEEIYRLYKGRSATSDTDEIRRNIMQEFKIGAVKCRTLMRRFVECDVNTFGDVEKWFKDNGCQYRVDWGREPPTKYPRLIVMATPGMQHNYDLYGDLVAFDITYGMLRNISSDNRRYRVGVFTVMDTNLRLLLAGIAILVDETTESFIKIFEQFFHVHGRVPQSFITDAQATIAQALKHLQQENIFTGVHMLDPWHLLKAIRSDLQCADSAKKLKLDQLKQLMMERNINIFSELLEELQQDIATKEVVTDLLNRKQHIFYCDVESSFIGIRRTNCEKIHDLIKREMPLEVTIEDFLKGICVMDAKLNQRSAGEFESMKEPQEVTFCDDRIRQIRLNFEYTVVQRFLENYIKGLRQCRLLDEGVDPISGKPWFLVGLRQNRTPFEIRNWACSCKEFEKTGVACPHLLLAAQSIPDKNYMDLISRRWRKVKPERKRQGAPRLWLRRGPPAPTRRNILKRARKWGAK